ncbi:hypothetical protein [Candidatus Magnetominusculus dajiuhuensis]|uniref:hypothetical protein n=1 Tax=Candidatus Magnetominusculus dajiuhuensis TaxID=3137712 RepID=UPI003B42B2DF
MICETFRNEYLEFECCIKYDGNDEIIPVEENDKSFAINNISRKRFMVIRIDDCVIRQEQMKCDYLYVNCDDRILYFIELKGSHKLKAIKQILMTLNRFKINEFYKNSKSVYAYIVSSVVNNPPNVLPPERIRLDTELENKNGELEIVQTPYEKIV